VVRLPGSKSQTNRALVLAALAQGPSRVGSPLRSRDTELMVAALGVLGVRVDDDGDDWVVHGGGLPLLPTGDRVDVGNAGTVRASCRRWRRWRPGRCASTATRGCGSGRSGRCSPRCGTIGADLDTVEALPGPCAARAAARGHRDARRVVVVAAGERAPAAGAVLRRGRRRAPRRRPAAERSAPGDDRRGAPRCRRRRRRRQPGRWRVRPGPLLARDVVVEPDLSTAAAYLAAPLVTGGSVTVPGWPTATAQPGAVLPELLEAMGGRVTRGAGGVTVAAGDGLHGIEADLRDASELTPVLAALAALADSPSRFWGVEHIRLHETDRLAALAKELTGSGGDVRESHDGLEIRPRPLTGGRARLLRRPPHRDGVGRARARRRRRAGRGRRDHPQDRARLRRLVDAHARSPPSPTG
jgi:3-phosphoshikimate 1-carboxyvinyltransferase